MDAPTIAPAAERDAVLRESIRLLRACGRTEEADRIEAAAQPAVRPARQRAFLCVSTVVTLNGVRFVLAAETPLGLHNAVKVLRERADWQPDPDIWQESAFVSRRAIPKDMEVRQLSEEDAFRRPAAAFDREIPTAANAQELAAILARIS